MTHRVPVHYESVFRHAYGVEEDDLRRLYENTKRDQWNVSRDLPWDQQVDLEQGVVADELIDIYGTPLWGRLGPRERANEFHVFYEYEVTGPNERYTVTVMVARVPRGLRRAGPCSRRGTPGGSAAA